jgi:hypothetical protein
MGSIIFLDQSTPCERRSRAKGAVEAIDKIIDNSNYCELLLSPTEREVQWNVAVSGRADRRIGDRVIAAEEKGISR